MKMEMNVYAMEQLLLEQQGQIELRARQAWQWETTARKRLASRFRLGLPNKLGKATYQEACCSAVLCC